MRAYFAVLMVALLPVLVTPMPAAPVPEVVKQAWRLPPVPHCSQGPDCKCKAKGYDCDCGKGPACNCVTTPVLADRDYAWLPSREICRQNVCAANEWAGGILREARALGYYGAILEEKPPFLACGLAVVCSMGDEWHAGGGPRAAQMQAEHAETIVRARVWRLVLALHEDSAEALPELERELRCLIGDAAFFAGRIPSPVPVWRVPRH